MATQNGNESISHANDLTLENLEMEPEKEKPKSSKLKGRDAKYQITGYKLIYFLSLVGICTEQGGVIGRPRKALSFFDVFSEMEFEETDGIIFLSVQDLLKYYQDQTGRKGYDLNGYQLVVFFMEKNPDALYFVDEVPLLRNRSRYDEKSIEMVKKFILDCKKAMKDNPFLWFAFQTNSLNDLCSSSGDFKSKFEDMVQYLEGEVDFFFPKLFMNMRNSREVTEVAKTIRTDYGFSEINSVIDSLKVWKSSICSYIPTLIPISHQDLDQNYSNLFDHATEKGKLNVILYREDSKFDVKKIQQAVLCSGVNEENIFIHTFDSTHTKEDIKDFLRDQQKGFLICQEELFTGMEAKSVVYCLDEYYGHDKKIRVNLMRACSQLNIILCYRKDSFNRIEFPSANLDPTFITGCEKVMKEYALKCKFCEEIPKQVGNDVNENEDIWICKSCSLSCHHWHQKEGKFVWDTKVGLKKESVKCECRTKHPICLFKDMK